MRPLVLLHGFTGKPSSFERMLASMESVGPLLCPTLLGHEGTGATRSVGGFRDEVDHQAAQIGTWAAAPAYLVGYSMGARIALALLFHHPRLFSGALLIGVNPGLDDPAERALRAAADDRWCDLLEREGIEAFVDLWESQRLFATQSSVPSAVLAEQRRVRLSHSSTGLARALRSLGLGAMPSYRSSLCSIQQPVEVLVGARDEKFMGLARELTAMMPRARLSVAPDAGHNLLLESPGEVARIVQKEVTS